MGRFKENFNLFRKNKLGVTGLFILVFFLLLAILGPILPRIDEMYQPMTGVDEEILWSTPPSRAHLLGTDFMGEHPSNGKPP